MKPLWSNILLCALLVDCHPLQSALQPAGPQANRILGVWHVFLAVSIVVFAVVMIALAYALSRRRRERTRMAPEIVLKSEARTERALSVIVGGAGVLIVLTLFGMLVESITVGHALGSVSTDNAMVVRVIGHQWWWEVHYPASPVSQEIITANEIHIPVGRRIALQLESRDVIHSFWVPALNGKRDLIPGHIGHLVIQADRPGVYRGQCAEFCGFQHAHMSILVIADSASDYAAWVERQRAPARNPANAEEMHGQQVFLTHTCVMCHTINGTVAGSISGPDLTHLASRRTLASGTVPNVRGHLTGWIADPQGIKPGANMPPNLLLPGELHDLVSYLESLQ